MKRILNAEIEKIGVYYTSHTQRVDFRIELNGNGWGGTITIPFEDVPEFADMMDKSTRMDFEDGIFLSDLEGTIVQVKMDDNGKIVELGGPLTDESEFMLIGKEG
jgi:hypothetical protein